VFLEEAERFTRARRLDVRMLGFRLDEAVRVEGVAGYYVKKRLGVVVVSEDRAAEAVEALASRGLVVRLLRPSLSPPRLTMG
jgi:pantoate kinase